MSSHLGLFVVAFALGLGIARVDAVGNYVSVLLNALFHPPVLATLGSLMFVFAAAFGPLLFVALEESKRGADGPFVVGKNRARSSFALRLRRRDSNGFEFLNLGRALVVESDGDVEWREGIEESRPIEAETLEEHSTKPPKQDSAETDDGRERAGSSFASSSSSGAAAVASILSTAAMEGTNIFNSGGGASVYSDVRQRVRSMFGFTKRAHIEKSGVLSEDETKKVASAAAAEIASSN